MGFQEPQQLLQKLAPPLSQTEEVYLQSLLEVASGLLGTVNYLCQDTRQRVVLGVRTMQMVPNHCILTALAPLSKDNLV